MKKLFYAACCCILFAWTSCHQADDGKVIDVDLNVAEGEIAYSRFVESVDDITLWLPDSLPVNGVERLFFDDHKVFMKDSGGEGIFVFDEETGKLLSRLDAFGEGPEDIKRIGAFCLDTYHKQMCIFDKGDQKQKMYDYEGNYVSSVPFSPFVLDMVKLEENSMTYFYPIYAGGGQPEGVWICDSLNRFEKQIDSHVTEDCKFHYFPMMYNWNDACVYYYDRNWDELSIVTADTLQLLYSFALRQSIPLSMKGMRNLSLQDLEGYAILHYFAYSDHFLLMNFYTFHQEEPDGKDMTWLLFDRRTEEKLVSKSLKNDLRPSNEMEGYLLFYKDDHTWVRVDDSSDDGIRLELLHLR